MVGAGGNTRGSHSRRVDGRLRADLEGFSAYDVLAVESDEQLRRGRKVILPASGGFHEKALPDSLYSRLHRGSTSEWFCSRAPSHPGSVEACADGADHARVGMGMAAESPRLHVVVTSLPSLAGSCRLELRVGRLAT